MLSHLPIPAFGELKDSKSLKFPLNGMVKVLWYVMGSVDLVSIVIFYVALLSKKYSMLL